MKAMNPSADYDTGRLVRPMEHSVQGSEVSAVTMVDNIEESKPPRPSEDVDHGTEADMIAQAETLSFAARLRMIILLSLIGWALVVAAVALIAG